MAVALEHTRREWEEASRRFEADARDPVRATPLLAELEVVTAELRRRVGQTFTLAELAQAYGAADRWSREAIATSAPAPGWPRRLALVTDAAFHGYSRGAIDYEP